MLIFLPRDRPNNLSPFPLFILDPTFYHLCPLTEGGGVGAFVHCSVFDITLYLGTKLDAGLVIWLYFEEIRHFLFGRALVYGWLLRLGSIVRSVQQNWNSLKFFTSHSEGDVTYSCHHNSSCFTFPILVHLWRFSVLHSLQSIMPCIYWPKTPRYSLNLKLKHEFYFTNFPKRMATYLCGQGSLKRKGCSYR